MTDQLKPKKIRKPRKKKEELQGSIASGLIFVGDCHFFAGSPVLELCPKTGKTLDVTPIDPLNPFNTADRAFDLAGDDSVNVELGPYLPGRGVLINTHLQGGSYKVKKKMKDGKLVGINITIKE
jgi:hypothetical protein